MKFAILLASFLFVLLQSVYWFGDHGFFELQNLEQDVQAQRDFNDKLHKRNARLRQQIDFINNHEGAIEEIARSELGLVKKGETFFLLVDNEPAE